MNPFAQAETLSIATQFYQKYYADEQSRYLILGINPGRFGAGLTGVPFTDPIKLADVCGIPNSLPRKPELSADFIHQVIHAMDGPTACFSRFYINSVFPLGFTKNGKNLNYYDQADLQAIAEPYSLTSIKAQLDFGLNRDLVFCLGEGKNYAFLSKLNQQHGLVKEIVPLPHPRFIMQYKRKQLLEYVDLYVKTLNRV